MGWREDYLVKRYPELVVDYDNFLLACERAKKESIITSNDLSAVRFALQSSRGPLWENAATQAKNLSLSNEAFLDLINETFLHRKAHARFAAICCLHKDHDPEFLDSVLRVALCDKSSKVRWKAAQVSNELNQIQLIDVIEHALKAEKIDKVRDSLSFSLRLLRDGYILKPSNAGQLSLTVGHDGGSLSTKCVTQAEIDARGIDAIVEERKSEFRTRFPRRG